MEKSFNSHRLKEALRFRGKRMTELAELTGISKQSLSLYAGGSNVPPYENVKKIADELDFPIEFFMTDDLCSTSTDNTYFRSMSSATKLMQNAQKIKLEYVAKVYEVMLNYVDIPSLNLPEVTFQNSTNVMVSDSREMQEQIENIAMKLRRHWGLNTEPIENMQYLLESNGIVVTGFNEANTKLDAFSQRVNIQGKGNVFIIALAMGMQPKGRLRYDMCHELGHIMLHDWDESNELLERDEFNALEKQANMFAGAFLMPRESFSKDLAVYATNLEYYKSLRKKWGVSVQAMIYRAQQLKLITPSQFQYMMRNLSSKGERTVESGDVPGELQSTIFQSAIDILFEGKYLNARSLMQAFNEYGICLRQKDLEDILGLESGTLDDDTKVIPFIKLRDIKE